MYPVSRLFKYSEVRIIEQELSFHIFFFCQIKKKLIEEKERELILVTESIYPFFRFLRIGIKTRKGLMQITLDNEKKKDREGY